MTTTFVLDIGTEAIKTTLVVVAPIMTVGFIVGIIVSFVQAIMQIQEMTLAFVPKLVAICGSLLFFGHWMLNKLMLFTSHMLGGFQNMIN